jgi:predicted enzyme related to lactoylglutathione lyase
MEKNMQPSQLINPRAFSHVGISVSDVEKAVEFHSDVMGWYSIMKPTEIFEEVHSEGMPNT